MDWLYNDTFTTQYTDYISPSQTQYLIYASGITYISLILGTLYLLFFQSYTESIPPPKGCRRLGLHPSQQSNLHDETSPKYAQGTPDNNTWKIKSLWIYPIKSCRGIELSSASVVETGLEFDRQFSFAQLWSPFPLSAKDPSKKQGEHKWRFITQREFPRLSQVTTELWIPDPTLPSYSKDSWEVKNGGVVIVRYPFQEDGIKGRLSNLAAKLRSSVPTKAFTIPFCPSPEEKTKHALEKFTLWKESPTALNLSSYIPPEFKYSLGVRNPLTIFRVSKPREVFRAAPSASLHGWQPIVGFADAYPINIMSLSSVQSISSLQPPSSPTLTVRRFRANIYLSGTPPFEEDTWKRIKLGMQEYILVCRCVRCTMPNINPDTGAKHKLEPLKTLKKERDVDKGYPGAACLGMNMVPVDKEGTVSVGDEVQVLERGETVYVPM